MAVLDGQAGVEMTDAISDFQSVCIFDNWLIVKREAITLF